MLLKFSGNEISQNQKYFFQKIITVFMACHFSFVINPLLTFAIKSKKMKNYDFLFLIFHNKHFINKNVLDEILCNTKKNILIDKNYLLTFKKFTKNFF